MRRSVKIVKNSELASIIILQGAHKAEPNKGKYRLKIETKAKVHLTSAPSSSNIKKGKRRLETLTNFLIQHNRNVNILYGRCRR